MTDADTLQHDVETARAAYVQSEQRLVQVVGAVYADAPEAAANILGIADEYGANEAVTAYLGCVQQFGDLNDRANDGLVADSSDWLAEALEKVLEARDRLDLATTARERHLRHAHPGRAQHVHISGREFIIDPEGRTLRSADTPAERYLLAEPSPPTPANSEPSLTQALAQERGVPPAQPGKGRDRSRSR